MEFSEARYAEIARKMAAEGDWITLWFLEGEPFWGKPPLAFWSVATSFLIFGINEFAARLPAMLASIATGWLLFQWLKTLGLQRLSWTVVAVYFSTTLILHISAVVLTDPILIFSTTLVMTTFYLAVTQGRRWAGYLMWAGLGIGLMAKGPIALVICGAACGSWVVITGAWGPLFRHSHLILGPLIMLVLAVPWYWLAEQKTPGFLEYFIVGEHFYRYTESEWAGDPYGAVKDMPFGTIWVMLLAAALPWSGVLLTQLTTAKRRGMLAQTYGQYDPSLLKYLLCWLLVPIVFFTPARNVIITYTLPAIPALAILTTLILIPTLTTAWTRIILWGSALIFLLGSIAVFELSIVNHRYNQKPILEVYQALNKQDPGLLVYTGKPRFAALFYAEGDMEFTRRPFTYLDSGKTLYLGVRDRWVKSMTPRLETRCELQIHRNDISLWYCPAVTP